MGHRFNSSLEIAFLQNGTAGPARDVRSVREARQLALLAKRARADAHYDAGRRACTDAVACTIRRHTTGTEAARYGSHFL